MQKPIKIFRLIKTGYVVLMMSTFIVTPTFAADHANQKASTGTVAAAPSFNESLSAPATNPAPQYRTQRTAGTSSVSPALALAMALGLRSVQGPVERRPAIAISNKTVPVTGIRQGFMLPRDGVYKKPSSNAAALRLALEAE